MSWTLKKIPNWLCDSCRFVIAITDDSGLTTRRCKLLEGYHGPETLRRKVVECDNYSGKHKSSQTEMERIAYILDIKAIRRGKPGFAAPGSAKHKELRDDDDCC